MSADNEQQPIRDRQRALYTTLLTALLLFSVWLVFTPEGLLGKAQAIGFAVCHQIGPRSFHTDKSTSPLCTRCTGLYVGFLFGFVFLQTLAPRRGGAQRPSVLLSLAALAAAFFFDIGNAVLTETGMPALYAPNNTVRIFSGTGFGIALAATLFTACNQRVWSDWDRRPAVAGPKDLNLLLFGGVVVALMLWSENSIVLYLGALLGALGVLVLLTVTYGLLVILAARQNNFAIKMKDLAVPLLLGFMFAVLQIAGADLLRFHFTGTWETSAIGNSHKLESSTAD